MGNHKHDLFADGYARMTAHVGLEVECPDCHGNRQRVGIGGYMCRCTYCDGVGAVSYQVWGGSEKLKEAVMCAHHELDRMHANLDSVESLLSAGDAERAYYEWSFYGASADALPPSVHARVNRLGNKLGWYDRMERYEEELDAAE